MFLYKALYLWVLVYGLSSGRRVSMYVRKLGGRTHTLYGLV